MQAYAIVIPGNEQSEAGFARLEESHRDVGNEFPLNRFVATTPGDVDEQMRQFNIKWTYPTKGKQERWDLGLNLGAYKSRNIKARMACFMSHYRLWRRYETLLILEDDAVFVKKLDPQPLLLSHYNAVGINDPRGATRLPDRFHSHVQNQPLDICAAPWIDDPWVPQGLAGASAYYMSKNGAGTAIGLADWLGAWPNDALLCKQLYPWLGITKTYYTKVQGTPSTL